MKIVAPDYYKEFHCIADKCRHTCCVGWEIDIDEESLERFQTIDEIRSQIEDGESPHFRLLPGERCPFLQEDGLCRMICRYGQEMLCQICTDHPRFRNYWEEETEIGLGLVCEEAARLILSWQQPMRLEILEEETQPEEITDSKEKIDGDEYDHEEVARIRKDHDEESYKDSLWQQEEFQEDVEEEETESVADEPDDIYLDEDELDDEAWLRDLRDQMLAQVAEEGPIGRLREYLIYRHIPNALYDDRLEERISLVDLSCRLIKGRWLEEWEKHCGKGAKEDSQKVLIEDAAEDLQKAPIEDTKENPSAEKLAVLLEIVRKFSYDIEYDEDYMEEILSVLEQGGDPSDLILARI